MKKYHKRWKFKLFRQYIVEYVYSPDNLFYEKDLCIYIMFMWKLRFMWKPAKDFDKWKYALTCINRKRKFNWNWEKQHTKVFNPPKPKPLPDIKPAVVAKPKISSPIPTSYKGYKIGDKYPKKKKQI